MRVKDWGSASAGGHGHKPTPFVLSLSKYERYPRGPSFDYLTN